MPGLSKATSRDRAVKPSHRAVIDAGLDAVIGLNPSGAIECMNAAAERMFGYGDDELVGDGVDQLFVCSDSNGAATTIRARLAQPQPVAINDHRIEARRKDGSCFPALLSVSELRTNGHRLFTAVVRDLTRSRAEDEEQLLHLNESLEHRVQERTALLTLLQNIAFAASLADSLEEAVAYALMRICRHFKWTFGCAFSAVGDSHGLTLLECSYGERPAGFEELRRELVRQSTPADRGLLSRVVSEGKPLWIDWSTEDPSRPAETEAGDVVAAFPLVVDCRVVSVLVFLLPRPFDLDSRSLDAMAAIGAQLGSLFERKQSESHLRSSEERFHAVFQNAAIGIALVEMGYGGRLLRTNRALNRMLGYGAYELNQSSLVKLCHPDDLEKSFQLHHELLEGSRKSYQLEARLRARDERIVWGRLLVSLIRNQSGRPVTTVLLVEDITDRKQAQEDLRRISLSIEHAREGIAHVNRDGCYTAANRAYAEIMGVRPEDLIGSSWESTLGDGERERARVARETMQLCGKAEFEGRSGFAQAARDYHAVLYRSADDPSASYYCFLEDVTERKRLEKEITDAVVDRQRRIGQELQEGLIQQLTGIRMMARHLRQRLEQRQAPELALAEDFVRLIADAQAQAKVIIKGLRPVEVDAEGLMAALQELAMATEQRFAIRCAFEAEHDVLIENNDTATQLFYIAQEAITSAVKREPAVGIVIRLVRKQGKLVMSISDDGPAIPGRLPDASGVNARIMHYRASMIGASLRISSADGGGTSVTCTL